MNRKRPLPAAYSKQLVTVFLNCFDGKIEDFPLSKQGILTTSNKVSDDGDPRKRGGAYLLRYRPLLIQVTTPTHHPVNPAPVSTRHQKHLDS